MLKKYIEGKKVIFHKIEEDPNLNKICIIGLRSVIHDNTLSKDQKSKAISYLFMVYYQSTESKEVLIKLCQETLGKEFSDLIK
jgi:hypothetical protein